MRNTIFENNLIELRKNNINVAEKLINYDAFDSVTSEVILVDGKPVLTAIKDGTYFLLDSLYDSSMPVKTLISTVVSDMPLSAKFVMFGFGNGMYVRIFLETVSEDHEIFVLEPSIEIFKTAMENYDLADLFRNKRFHIEVLHECNETSFRTYFKKMFVYTDIYTIRYSVYTNYQILFPEYLDCWIEQLNYSLSLIGSEGKLYEESGKTFIINNYSCFPYVPYAKSLKSLASNMPRDIPAIIVSAGPSLSKNITELKNAKGRAFIIAVDAAVNPLLRNGIVPDLMVSIDPIKGEEYIREKGADGIPLVSGMNCCAALTKSHKGEKIYISDLNPFIERFFVQTCGMLPQLSTGGSVSNSAFHLAYLLGCRRMILVGQDLAYTEKKSHAVGSVRGNETLNQLKDEPFEDAIDINGEPILTSRMFIWFKIWFEDFIVKHKDICVIDSTEGGIKIEGTEIMNLRDAISSYCNKEFDFNTILKRTNYLLTEEQGEKFMEYIKSLPVELDKVVLQIHEGLNCYASIRRIVVKGDLTSKELRNYALKANKILDDIQSNCYLEYVKYLIQKYTNKMLKTINNTNSDAKKELLEISDIGTEYLKQLEKEIFTLKDMIKDCEAEWNL